MNFPVTHWWLLSVVILFPLYYVSRKANDQGRFDKVKTRLTTKEEEEGE